MFTSLLSCDANVKVITTFRTENLSSSCFMVQNSPWVRVMKKHHGCVFQENCFMFEGWSIQHDLGVTFRYLGNTINQRPVILKIIYTHKARTAKFSKTWHMLVYINNKTTFVWCHSFDWFSVFWADRHTNCQLYIWYLCVFLH